MSLGSFKEMQVAGDTISTRKTTNYLLCFAHILDPPEQTIHIGEHQHLLSLVYVSSLDQLFYDIWQVQRGLKSIRDVCQQLHVISGLQHFNVLPGIAED